MARHPLRKIVDAQAQHKALGTYAICSANPFVLEAAMKQARADGTAVLIESTSNQVDQFGGYTGMTPDRFVTFVGELARWVGLPSQQIILGGDHLGPNSWQKEPAAEAMRKACDLVAACVKAGYTKIHLDASMRLGDDPGDVHTPPPPDVVAARAADLCAVAEQFSKKAAVKPVYVIGTEVPIPGGAQEVLHVLQATRVADARQTIQLARDAFRARGLDAAWDRVVALVVQPAVEFGDATVVDYDRSKAKPLAAFLKKRGGMVYEAHSTDYQPREALRQMVEDGFAILKVGPQLTYAFREALFALEAMEVEWLGHRADVTPSGLRDTLERVMLVQPGHWQKHYHGDAAALCHARKYSYSDRSRYYWPNAELQLSLERLIRNLTMNPVPMTLISQYMPAQYWAIREGRLSADPLNLIHDKIMEVTSLYAHACGVLKRK